MGAQRVKVIDIRVLAKTQRPQGLGLRNRLGSGCGAGGITATVQ